jgi:LPXTG-site transpeptidase (sortase) family protein
MASEYVMPGPLAEENTRGGFLGSPNVPSVNVAGSGFNPGVAPGTAAEAGEPERFRGGSLSPTGAGSQEAGTQKWARRRRSGPIGIFDMALLTAEVISAIIVTWLVAQYIYTVYFDTTPRRLTPATGASSHRTGQPLQVPRLDTPTLAPTRIAQVTPPLQGTPYGAVDAANSDGTHGVNTGRPLDATPTWTPTDTPTATPTVDPALLLPSRLKIPVMFLDSPVHEVVVNMGVWQVSSMQIGHHEGTANPGETGNMVLAGHRDINSALFRDLDRLKPGDEIFVFNGLQQEYRYVVRDSYVVTPDHTEVMDPTDDKRATLITCTPVGLGTQRLIVTAILDEQVGNR